jgi:hypothetical protein
MQEPDQRVVRERVASSQVAQVPHETPLDGAEPRLA